MNARCLALAFSMCTAPLACAFAVPASDDAAPHPHDAGTSDALVIDFDAMILPDASAKDAVAESNVPDALPALPCDSKFTVPSAVYANTPFAVAFTDSVGWVYIGLSVSGPGSPASQLTNITGSFTWHFQVSGQAAGQLHMTFTKDNGTNVASCDVWVQ